MLSFKAVEFSLEYFEYSHNTYANLSESVIYILECLPVELLPMARLSGQALEIDFPGNFSEL